MEFIQKELKEIKELLLWQNMQQKEFLTLEEIAKYLSQSKSSIYKLTSKREIPFYVPKGKLIYFSKSEINEWILRSKVSSFKELDKEVDEYISKSSRS